MIPRSEDHQRSHVSRLLAAVVMGLLPNLAAMAVDVARPAGVRFVVQDDRGRALPGVQVRLPGPIGGWPETTSSPVVASTDANGVAVVERTCPGNASRFTWSETAGVDLDGYLPTRIRLSLFPGARVEQTVQLQQVRTTRLRLRGPGGEALARVGIHVSYGRGRVQFTDHGEPEFLFTNEQGECDWHHGTLPEGFHVWGRPEQERFKDELVVTVVYKEGELPRAAPLLKGKLLHVDGSAAAGWIVARKVRFVGSGGFTGSESRNTMQFEGLTRIGADGNFEADAEEFLAVVSPEGTPFLHELAPGTWPPGDRHVTLRVPKVRSVHHGRMVYKDGSPVVGFPLEIEVIRSGGKLWEIYDRTDAAGYPRSLCRSSATDGTSILGIRTDDQGRYTVSTYFASKAKFLSFRDGWHLDDQDGLSFQAQSVWSRGKSQDHTRFKDVTLVFEDERGQQIPSVQCSTVTMFVAGEEVHLDADGGQDSRGRHLFVDRSIDRIKLETNDWQRKWLPVKQEIDLRGTEDQVVRVTLDNSKRLRPLAGQILDPDGRGVKGVRVFLYNAKHDPRGNNYLQLDAITDDDGKFLIDAVPDQCFIELDRSRERADAGLPGWSLPIAVDETKRDVTIRLQRGGTIAVLLPPTMGSDAAGLYLQRDDAPVEGSSRQDSAYFTQDGGAERQTDILRPGWYLLKNYQPESTEAFAALGDVRAEVRPGERTVVDLRDRQLPERRAAVAQPKSSITVVVKHDKQIISGVEVTVLASVARQEDLARWIAESSSEDPRARKTALEMLNQAGAQGVDAIRAAGGKVNRSKLLKELDDVEFDGLHKVIRDLSDDAGQVRCDVETGRSCVVVARVRGVLIGWQAFVSGIAGQIGNPSHVREDHAANQQTVEVDLHPARTLVVRWNLPVDKEREIEGPAHIRISGPTGIGLRALMSVLCEAHPSLYESAGWVHREAVFNHQYQMRNERNRDWAMEDLPIGAACTIALPAKPRVGDRRPRKVTIESGDGDQLFEWSP